MSPVATDTLTPGWGLSPTPAYTVIYTGKLHHERGRYPLRTLAQDHRPALLVEISGALRRHPMSETQFGKRAVRDGAFVGDLRRGRRLRPATAIKVRAFIALLDAQGGC